MAPAPLPASPAPTFPLSTAVKSKTTFENADYDLSSCNVYLYDFKITKAVFSYNHNRTIICGHQCKFQSDSPNTVYVMLHHLK